MGNYNEAEDGWPGWGLTTVRSQFVIQFAITTEVTGPRHGITNSATNFIASDRVVLTALEIIETATRTPDSAPTENHPHGHGCQDNSEKQE